MIQTEQEEVLDLVDKNDQVIGQILRGDLGKLAEGAGYVRASDAFIMNSKGELWIPRRTLTKTIAPGGYDFSAAEHVGTGETYEQAMIRGFGEELNLTVDRAMLQELATLPPEGDIHYFRTVYLYRTDETPQYNQDDFTGYEWLTPQALRQHIMDGEPAKSAIVPSLDLLEKTLENKE